MSGQQAYLAFDLGAESGRAILGILADGRMTLQDLHRFSNGPCRLGDRLHWDALRLFAEMKTGLAKASDASPVTISSLGIDTWGVDFGLIDKNGELLGNPIHYRDPRTNGVFERAFRVVPQETIFDRTGIQFLQFNSLFQLHAMREMGSPALDAADRLLMVSDLFNFWFTGERSQEFSMATTTQCWDTRRGEWAFDLIDAFKIPRRIFGEVRQPGAVLAPIRAEIAAECGAPRVPVALPATHDTGSAVVAVPASGDSFAYVSCGTWSLVGMETREPIVTPRALDYNFTNEGGAFGTNRLLCNVMGLWLLQGCRRSWSRTGRQVDYAEIVEAARRAPAGGPIIEPDDQGFFNPEDMVESIHAFCARTGQRAPESMGEAARCVIESLALKYRLKIEQAESLCGRRAEVIHIVGGGCRNDLLCQTTADVCGRPVLAGPAEGTAMGNLVVQAAAMGAIKGLDEARRIVRDSSEVAAYEPRAGGPWEGMYERFKRLGA